MSAYDPKRTFMGLCDLAATYSYAAFKYRYRSVHFLSLSMPDYLVGVTCATREPSRSLVPVYSSFALRTLSLADVFRQEKFAAPETFTEFALVLAIRFGFKLGAICHVLDLQVYPAAPRQCRVQSQSSPSLRASVSLRQTRWLFFLGGCFLGGVLVGCLFG